MSATVTGDGTSIAYSAWGRRDRTPIVMIQGLGLDHRGWALQRGAFGRRHHCIAPDNRGTGQSDAPPGPYDLMHMATDVLAVMDAEDIDRAHIVGASMGGIIAQVLGVMHPDRVTSLTLACTACQHHEWRRELLAEWAEVVEANGMSGLMDDAMRWLIGPRLHRRFGVFVNVLARVLVQTEPHTFVAQVGAILDTSDELRFALPQVTAPTLVVTGSQDTLTPFGDAEELAELISPSRLYVLRGAAHGLMAEAPNAFNDVVLKFIDEIDRANRYRPKKPPDAVRTGGSVEGAGRRQMMLAPPRDPVAVERAHRQATPADHHTVVRADGRGWSSRRARRRHRSRTRGGARRTQPAPPTRIPPARSCGNDPCPRPDPTASRSPCRRPSNRGTPRGRRRATRRRDAGTRPSTGTTTVRRERRSTRPLHESIDERA